MTIKYERDTCLTCVSNPDTNFRLRNDPCNKCKNLNKQAIGSYYQPTDWFLEIEKGILALRMHDLEIQSLISQNNRLVSIQERLTDNIGKITVILASLNLRFLNLTGVELWAQSIITAVLQKIHSILPGSESIPDLKDRIEGGFLKGLLSIQNEFLKHIVELIDSELKKEGFE